MNKKRLTARRAHNAELARIDAANRCGTCKRELPTRGVHMHWGDPKMYCSSECLDNSEARKS